MCPVTDLVPVTDDGTTGTTVHFLVDPALGLATHVDVSGLRDRGTGFLSRSLSVRVIG